MMSQLHYLAMQYKEIIEYKRIQDHQQPYQTIDEAMQQWSNNGKAVKFRSDYNLHINNINDYCNTCDKCQGVKGCIATLDCIHGLLEDKL